eukprot:COSAG06_NODE_3916_length_4771_cov_2.058219_3_plen_165_part_00
MEQRFFSTFTQIILSRPTLCSSSTRRSRRFRACFTTTPVASLHPPARGEKTAVAVLSFPSCLSRACLGRSVCFTRRLKTPRGRLFFRRRFYSLLFESWKAAGIRSYEIDFMKDFVYNQTAFFAEPEGARFWLEGMARLRRSTTSPCSGVHPSGLISCKRSAIQR